MPKFSIVIPYRNRPIENVNRCLESIQNQTYQDFEIIFSDYGSVPEYQKAISEFISKIPQAKYIYNETRGMFWNRSEALNLGAEQARGEFLFFCDVDLILIPNFLEYYQSNLKETCSFVFPLWQLPKNFKRHHQILKSDNWEKLFKISKLDKITKGNFFISRKIFKQSRGFHPFFRVWGYEDLEFVRRVQEVYNIQLLEADAYSCPVFHQWHPAVGDDLPIAWRHLGYKIYQNRDFDVFSTKKKIVQLYKKENRPTLRYYLENKTKAIGNFQFQYPREYSFNLFYKKAFLLKENEFLIIHQEFSEIKKEGKSRLRKLASLVNLFLKRINISYRITDIQTHHEEFITSEDIEAFLFYFLLFQDRQFDYFFEKKQEEILLILTPIEIQK